MPTAVDGGYISWTYGYSAERLEIWDENCLFYTFKHWNRVILLDSIRDSFRIEFDDNYKSRRREKRATDTKWDDKTRHVVHFRRYILEADERFRCSRVEGYEADDLIALLAYSQPIGEPLQVIGVDKDFLQIPSDRLRMNKCGGDQVTLDNFIRRLPKSLQPYVHHHRHVLVCLGLMGDRSDSVSRLVPVGQLRTMVQILRDSRPLTAAYSQFGDAFLHNLYLTVLPGPWCFTPVPSPLEVYDLVRRGSWPPDLQLSEDLQYWLNWMNGCGFNVSSCYER